MTEGSHNFNPNNPDRNMHFDELVKRAQKLQNTAESEKRKEGVVVDISNHETLDSLTNNQLLAIYQVFEKAGIRPEKNQKVLNIPDFMNQLGSACVVKKDQVITKLIVVEIFSDDAEDRQTLVFKGKVGDFYQTYFKAKKRFASSGKNTSSK